MKNLLLFSLCVLFFGITACSDDEDDCMVDSLEMTIVGTWKISLPGDDSTVEFHSDGTLIDPEGAIYEVEINGEKYEEKSYAVLNDTLIQITASNGTQNSNVEYTVKSYSCNDMKWEFWGFVFDFDKK